MKKTTARQGGAENCSPVNLQFFSPACRYTSHGTQRERPGLRGRHREPGCGLGVRHPLPLPHAAAGHSEHPRCGADCWRRGRRGDSGFCPADCPAPDGGGQVLLLSCPRPAAGRAHAGGLPPALAYGRPEAQARCGGHSLRRPHRRAGQGGEGEGTAADCGRDSPRHHHEP